MAALQTIEEMIVDLIDIAAGRCPPSTSDQTTMSETDQQNPSTLDKEVSRDRHLSTSRLKTQLSVFEINAK